MPGDNNGHSRREFMKDVGRTASAVALSSSLGPAVATAAIPNSAPAGPWDLAWIARLASATDRAVFDWPALGDPSDPTMVMLAARYLDNCAAAYGSQPYVVRIVLNIRTQAVPAALTDAMWSRFRLGTEYNVKDSGTSQPAERNPFLYRAPSPAPNIVMPCMTDLLQAGAIVLVCDFALGHLSNRLATKFGQTADEVHTVLRAGLIPGAYAVPSGIFGLARAQNAGCALVHV